MDGPGAVTLLVIGGGIVGLATAHCFGERFPDRRVVVLEEEDGVGRHQSGHNSGVLHSGIYYEPGSLKASSCRRGKRLMEGFCAQEGIPFETCGKLVVAVDDSELPRLAQLEERARANGVACAAIGPERLREIEPEAAGVRALHVPETGIVDYSAVCARLAQRIVERGGEIVTGAREVEDSDEWTAAMADLAMTLRYSHLSPAHQLEAVQRLTRKPTGTTTGTEPEAEKVAADGDAQRREKAAVERAGDRGRTGDVQLGKLSGSLWGKGFSAAVAERG